MSILDKSLRLLKLPRERGTVEDYTA